MSQLCAHLQEVPEFSQLHLLVLREERGGQPETETHPLGPALQGCEHMTTHTCIRKLGPPLSVCVVLCVIVAQDIGFWMRDKQEVEIVDFLLQVKECLVCESFNSHPSIIYSLNSSPYSSHLPLHSSSQGPPGSIPQCQLRQSTLSSHRSELSFPLSLRTCSPVLNPLSLLPHKHCLLYCPPSI